MKKKRKKLKKKRNLNKKIIVKKKGKRIKKEDPKTTFACVVENKQSKGKPKRNKWVKNVPPLLVWWPTS